MTTKQDLINNTINEVLNPSNDYGGYLKEILEEHFKSQSFDTLWDFLYEGSDKKKEYQQLTYSQETIEIAHERAQNLSEKFIKEVSRLLNSGAVESEHHNRGMLYGVALENLADDFLRGDRKTKEYKNLKHF
jgi:hypothetical protein